VSLDVLLEILGALERLATEVALMRLQRHVNADVRSNVITLDGGSAAVTPLARQIQVVGALAPNVAFAYVILQVH
jgi:HAMP domain-containing protein